MYRLNTGTLKKYSIYSLPTQYPQFVLLETERLSVIFRLLNILESFPKTTDTTWSFSLRNRSRQIWYKNKQGINMDCLYRECRIGSFSGTQSSQNLNYSLTNQKEQRSPVLEIIYGGLGKYLAEMDDLVLFLVNGSHVKNTVSAYRKAFMNLEKIKKAELSNTNKIIFGECDISEITSFSLAREQVPRTEEDVERSEQGHLPPGDHPNHSLERHK